MKKIIAWFLISILIGVIIIPISTGLANSVETANENISRGMREIPDWTKVETISRTVEISPGGKYYISLDTESGSLDAMEIVDPTEALPQTAKDAINKVPQWLKFNLTRKFLELSSSYITTYAQLITGAADDKYVDEIAFAIAHTSKNVLENSGVYPQVFVENAENIYAIDPYLDYVNITEKNDPILGNYSTTVYYNKTGVKTEVPMDIYYWYLVHPKISDEIPTFVNLDNAQPTSPPTGKFWRDFLFNHNDTGYPLIKNVTNVEDRLWKGRVNNKTDNGVIGALTQWIQDVMDFKLDNPNYRPIQPAAIYRKHEGFCGEHADITAAAARAVLIPCKNVNSHPEDHVWNEFWDGGWVHWEPVNPYIDDPTKYDRAVGGWNRKISAPWGWRGDGYITEETARYTNTCTFTATVLDQAGEPVDGAEVMLATGYYQNPSQLVVSTWAFTDTNGQCTFILGDDHTYYGYAKHSSLGKDPVGDNQVTQVFANSQQGQSYSHTFNLPNTMNIPQINIVPSPSGQKSKYKFEIDFNVTRGTLSGSHHYSNEKYYLDTESSRQMDFFICNSSEYKEYNKYKTFDAYETADNFGSRTISFIVPGDEEDTWYMILSNEDALATTKIVNITVSIFGTLSAKITTPKHGSKLDLDSVITITGTGYSPLTITGVEIDIDNNNNWQAASDVSGGSGSPWNTWEFDWNTKGLAPGKHNIRARASDSKLTFVTSMINVTLVDVTEPVLDIDQPLNSSTFKIGEVITITGTANDNVGVSTIELLFDNDQENLTNITTSYKKGKWSYELYTSELTDGNHTISIHALDTANNYNISTIQIILLEIVNPVVTITSPINNSIIKLGNSINIKGVATDNKKVTKLELIIDNDEPINLTSSLKLKGKWSYEWDTGELSVDEGIHTMEIKALDAVQNVGSTRIYFTLDGTQPEISITKPIENQIFSVGDEVLIQGTATDNIDLATLELIFDNSYPINITANLVDNNWSYKDLETEDLKSGEHNITIRTTDLVGLVSETSVIITIDANPPKVDIKEIIDPILIDETIIFEGTASDDIAVAILELIIDDNEIINITSEYSSLNGTWSYVWNTSGMTEGTHEIAVKITDIVDKQTSDKINIKLISYATDTDKDGMPDWWEMLFERLDPNKNDAEWDYDKDGFTNLEEYLGDDGLPENDDYSNPLDRTSVPYRKEEKPTVNGNDFTLLWIILIIIMVIIPLVILFMILKKKKRKLEETAILEKGTIVKQSKITPSTRLQPQPPISQLEGMQPPMPPFPMMFPPGTPGVIPPIQPQFTPFPPSPQMTYTLPQEGYLPETQPPMTPPGDSVPTSEPIQQTQMQPEPQEKTQPEQKTAAPLQQMNAQSNERLSLPSIDRTVEKDEEEL